MDRQTTFASSDACHNQATLTAPTAEDPACSKKANIMVVDDSKAVRFYHRHVASLVSGKPCIEVANGKEALEQLPRHPIDLILLDIFMPTMDGEDFLHALEKGGIRDIPVLLISSENRTDLIRPRAPSCAPIKLLQKPVGRSVLIREIQDLLAV